MNNAIYLTLRRMRLPLITLILAYAWSIGGLVLIPGQDDAGNPWRMDFFHAFYFVSFMGSTIGFGEIPYPFTDPQRMWVSISLYVTVIAWLYTIGSLLAIIQDPVFRRVVSHNAFVRAVKRIGEPFYIVCGYGDAGALIVRELVDRGIPCTVIDQKQENIDNLEVTALRLFVPGYCADPGDPDVLLDAGLRHPCCKGVVVATRFDATNLKVAISAKLLEPELNVIARAETLETQRNLASFGTDHIFNPYETFARRLGMMFHSPTMHLIYEWITSLHDAPLQEYQSPPEGTWVLCGYGRFGKAIRKYLNFEQVEPVVIEADPHSTLPPDGFIIGTGTEADTLTEAGIEQAVGIIAGTDDDTNNLSMIITAKELNPDLFTVARQNQSNSDAIFRAAELDMVIQPSVDVGHRIVAQILTPLLGEFLALARTHDEEWANVLISRLTGVFTDQSAGTWTIDIGADDTPAVRDLIDEGREIELGKLTTDPHDRETQLSCLPLLLVREERRFLLPPQETPLHRGDRILFCGLREAESSMRFTANNYNVLNYVCTGENRPSGRIWSWLSGEKQHA